MERELSELLQIRRQKLTDQKKWVLILMVSVMIRVIMLRKLKQIFETFDGQQVSIAGRIMAKRGHGKASFAGSGYDRSNSNLHSFKRCGEGL